MILCNMQLNTDIIIININLLLLEYKKVEALLPQLPVIILLLSSSNNH